MSVTLLRAYMSFASGAVVTFSDDTEAALIAQGIATAKDSETVGYQPPGTFQTVNQGGNIALINQQGQGVPTYPQGPSKLCNTPLNAGVLLTAYDTNGTVHVAGTMYWSEIYVPTYMSVTGAAALNGTTVGTNKLLYALYNSAGALLRNTAVAGVTTANASTFQEIAFTSPITLAPGRYWIGVQCNGTTDTTRALLTTAVPNTLTASATGVFGTVPATMTVPTSPTSAAGRIAYLYT